MSPLRVLICGGGIAGNALAFWLRRLGHEATVIERSPGLRATGLQVDLRGHGVDVLRRMGLEAAFRARAAPETGMQVVDARGTRKAFFPVNEPGGKGEGKRQAFTAEFEIMRGDLCGLLHEAATAAGRAGAVKYVFGASVESLVQKETAEGKGHGVVEVRFAGGDTAEFDLVVGADGQWSRMRGMLFGGKTASAASTATSSAKPMAAAPIDDATAATSPGLYPLRDNYVAYFTLPWPVSASEGDAAYVATAYTAPGRRAILTRRNGPTAVGVYLSCKTSSPVLRAARPGDAAAEKAAFADIFAGVGWRGDEIVRDMMRGADDFYCERMALVQLGRWHTGRAALLGDAAYCPSANTGMGTTCALVGAYVLAGEIGRHCGRGDAGLGEGGGGGGDGGLQGGVEAALAAYDARFRPFMDQVQKGLLDGSDVWDRLPSTQFGITIMNLVLGLAGLLKLNFFGEFVMREKITGWELPEYEEMLSR